MRSSDSVILGCIVLVLSLLTPSQCAEQAVDSLRHVDLDRGVVALINLPPGGADAVVKQVASTKVLLYFQSANAQQVEQLQGAADRAGLLGTRIFVNRGGGESIQLATDLADRVVVIPQAGKVTPDSEIVPQY